MIEDVRMSFVSYSFVSKNEDYRNGPNYIAGFISCENLDDLISIMRSISKSVDRTRFDFKPTAFHAPSNSETGRLGRELADIIERKN